jgi:3-hydroxybutyryl-CoA dehydrogenase
MELKKALFDQLDEACRADTILATNISSLSISEIAGGTRYGARVAGIYFFNPAPVMKLVEVISTVVTSPEIAETLALRSRDLGKTPVRVSDRAGFVVNALLFPYLKSGRGFYDCRRPSTPTAPAEDHGRAPVPTDVAVPQLNKVRET